eukprot:869544-Lingulodinium_polyedra.AAC.1
MPRPWRPARRRRRRPPRAPGWRDALLTRCALDLRSPVAQCSEPLPAEPMESSSGSELAGDS